jgi:hypothetical protein
MVPLCLTSSNDNPDRNLEHGSSGEQVGKVLLGLMVLFRAVRWPHMKPTIGIPSARCAARSVVFLGTFQEKSYPRKGVLALTRTRLQTFSFISMSGRPGCICPSRGICRRMHGLVIDAS